MKKVFGDYYLGLDIGTDSLGWAVTDMDYKVLKFNRKAMWGVRLFESGKTAEERRLHRTARRRLERRNQRIDILQELFSEAINAVDPGFFLRMEESKYWHDDKTIDQYNTLFNDKDFSDQDYHNQYPTIYHLRYALMNENQPFDVRLVYLALHNIIKKRGHFLFAGQKMDSISKFENVFEQFQNALQQNFDFTFSDNEIDAVADCLKNKQISKTDKQKQLQNYLKVDKSDDNLKKKKEIIKLMVGAKAKLAIIFDKIDWTDAEVKDITFDGTSYEDNYDKLSNVLEDQMVCIDQIKAIYDWSVLEEILHGEKYLSQAKIGTYEKHKNDLQILKRIIKSDYPQHYKPFFCDGNGKDNYCAYVGTYKKGKRKTRIAKEQRCDQEALCKALKKILVNDTSTDPDYLYLKQEIENYTLLPKQINKDNGVIPYQLHLIELERILEKARGYLPFLTEKDEQGWSAEKKILSLFKFRIPYYVGPLNDSHKQDNGKGFCWIKRKSDGPIRPWNFEEKVDIEASAENFIRRMTNKCTYVFGADVLPKDSLLYSRFMVLNEINNLTIDGIPLESVAIKQQIYNDLFKKKRKLRKEQLITYLLKEGIIDDHAQIGGVDDTIKANLASEQDFVRILGKIGQNQAMVENLIKWIVLFGDDVKLLENKIRREYGDVLNEAQIKAIKKLKYSGWGRLSREFLEDICIKDKNENTGEYISIIQSLWETNDNLMQLLSQKYKYQEELKKYNGSKQGNLDDTITYNTLDDIYVSPAVKRSIWQTLQIIKEIAKITGHAPKKVFVEMARGPEEKKRTKSRKQQLLELYEKCKEESRDWMNEIESRDEKQFRKDALFLYYTQMGRCMYTGEIIDVDDLFRNSNLYDIDHIYPQCKVKDDSIDNRVLVQKQANLKKADNYPLSQDVRDKNRSFWMELAKKDYISKRKLERLVRSTKFEKDELAGFINRQLVETRQSTKAVATILQRVFPKTAIVYSKAGNVSRFRHDFGMLKVREVNDYHHAKDAYLNIVVGNVYDTKFTRNPLNIIKKEGEEYSLNQMYKKDVERDGVIAWKAGGNGSIVTVKSMMRKNNILFTRHAYENKGELFDQQIVKKGSGQLPIKTSDSKLADISRYGGYNKVSGAFFMYVEHTLKKKRVHTMEYVPVYRAREIYNNEQSRINYCKNNLGLVEPIVLIKHIKINTLFEIDGFRMHLSGRTGKRLIFKGANQLIIDKNFVLYLKRIEKYLGRCQMNPGKKLTITSYDGITTDENIQLYSVFLDKLKNAPYQSRLSTQISTIEKGKEQFIELGVDEQCVVLNEILHLFQCNSVAANLKKIGGPASAGILVTSSQLEKFESVLLIHQSATGLFEKIISLKE